MTIAQTLARFDTVYPNAFSYEDKLKWLSDLDGLIFCDVISRYDGQEGGVFAPYTIRTEKTVPLLVPFPHDDLYIRYLAAQCDLASGDTDRYQNSSTVFNTAYNDFVNHYNRTHEANGVSVTF